LSIDGDVELPYRSLVSRLYLVEVDIEESAEVHVAKDVFAVQFWSARALVFESPNDSEALVVVVLCDGISILLGFFIRRQRVYGIEIHQGFKQERAFPIRPPVVMAGLDQVYRFDIGLSDVADEHLPRLRP